MGTSPQRRSGVNLLVSNDFKKRFIAELMKTPEGRALLRDRGPKYHLPYSLTRQWRAEERAEEERQLIAALEKTPEGIQLLREREMLQLKARVEEGIQPFHTLYRCWISVNSVQLIWPEKPMPLCPTSWEHLLTDDPV